MVQEFQKLLEYFNSLKQQLTQFPKNNSRPEPNKLDDIQSQFKFLHNKLKTNENHVNIFNLHLSNDTCPASLFIIVSRNPFFMW